MIEAYNLIQPFMNVPHWPLNPEKLQFHDPDKNPPAPLLHS